MRYVHINNNNKKLLIVFSDMAKVGITDDTFASFKILKNIFNDYDILFVKDIKLGYWYLTIMEFVYNLICNIIQVNNYKFIYGLTSSSGAMCLLNILYRFNIFTKAVIVNGQTTLSDDIVNKYKSKCRDCRIFNKKEIKESYNEDYIIPFKKIPTDTFDKYIFYYCSSVSDKVYYEYIKSIYPTDLHNNIYFNETNSSHSNYIGCLLNDNKFLTNVKNTFDNSSLEK
jgi:hypothetical protein